LLWRGGLDPALPRAQLALELQIRHVEQVGPEDALLVARIEIARGDADRARGVLQELEVRCPPATWSPTAALLGRMVHLAVDGADAAAWDALVECARDVLLPEEKRELDACIERAREREA
jgi:hypothetical protein